jgi:hypothetical protein
MDEPGAVRVVVEDAALIDADVRGVIHVGERRTVME